MIRNVLSDGLCEKRCPAIHPIQSHNSENPGVYAAWTKDDKVQVRQHFWRNLL